MVQTKIITACYVKLDKIQVELLTLLIKRWEDNEKILLLSTGGTIGCIQTTGDGLIPGIPIQKLVRYLPLNENEVQISTETVVNIDSTNMQPEHWEEIARTVYDNYHHFDGFVITHGTDTLSYTSAALSYFLRNLQKPVVLTGSIQPIDAKKRTV